MEIRIASTTPGKSSQLRNVNSIRWEYRNITTQQGDFDDMTDTTFVVNAGINITANYI